LRPIVVIGGGPAGIAAACHLAEQGQPVILFEGSARLGGRAASFNYERMNAEIDYGQHVSMRCCTETVRLLKLLGTADSLRFQRRLSVPVTLGKTRSPLFSFPALGRFSLMPSLLRYRHLSWPERFSAIRFGVQLTRNPPGDKLFSHWLSAGGQTERSIRRLWNPVCIASLNGTVNSVSAQATAFLFRQAFLSPHGADLGLFTAPLSQVFSHAIPFLNARAGEVMLRSPVKRIIIEGTTATGIELSTGEKIKTAAIIATLPPSSLLPLLPQGLSNDRYFNQMAQIPSSPIVNLHLWFDRPVMSGRFLIAVESPIQAVFDVTKIHENPGPPFHVVISQSAAVDWISRPMEGIKRTLIPAVDEILPLASSASLVHALVTKFPTATFLPAPKTEKMRPRQRSPLASLFIAGDYTATGWPSTIEGAIRSGISAAKLTA
jgi:squalene-associated FAD-dependent desaturase